MSSQLTVRCFHLGRYQALIEQLGALDSGGGLTEDLGQIIRRSLETVSLRTNPSAVSFLERILGEGRVETERDIRYLGFLLADHAALGGGLADPYEAPFRDFALESGMLLFLESGLIGHLDSGPMAWTPAHGSCERVVSGDALTELKDRLSGLLPAAEEAGVEAKADVLALLSAVKIAIQSEENWDWNCLR